MNLCLVLDVTALSTALYSNDCFIVSKEQVDKDNQRQHREGAILEDQKGLLTMDDIDLKKQVAICKYMPDSVKKAALEKIEEMKSSIVNDLSLVNSFLMLVSVFRSFI